MKLCFKCKIEKPATEFYRHPRMADGLLGKCKDCTRADVKDRRQAKQSEIREYDRARSSLPHRVEARKAYRKTAAFRASRNGAVAKWKAEHKVETRAHKLVKRAIDTGRLIAKPCEECGSEVVEAHHDDYSKPLDVRWLCVAHHRQHHKALRAQQRAAQAA